MILVMAEIGKEIGDRDWQDFAQRLESIAGDVFEEELHRVEVRLLSLDADLDIYERPVFFTIDVAEQALHHDPDALAGQFIVGVREQFPDLGPFRVWVRVVHGSFKDVT